jgi:hypothetical protein
LGQQTRQPTWPVQQQVRPSSANNAVCSTNHQWPTNASADCQSADSNKGAVSSGSLHQHCSFPVHSQIAPGPASARLLVLTVASKQMSVRTAAGPLLGGTAEAPALSARDVRALQLLVTHLMNLAKLGATGTGEGASSQSRNNSNRCV